ncbi:ATP-grasp domain-containing protein [Catellatospora vulcania]|uniref:ATP-grasp domain-containing protein n=1 Tax=Catellatospora vulcania TaxID=1460450 RepID=UPI0012D4B508|nr:ATP-grasp domain-containing protein [Catellatospora vulcania]
MRLLMVGADLPALAALGPDVEVTVLLGATTKDGWLPLPDGVRTVFVDDHKSLDAAVNGLLRAGFGPGGFDAVYAYDDPALMTAAALAAMLGARGVPPGTVALFRDKSLQKQALRAAGLPVTSCTVIDDIRELPPGYRLPYPKAVVKPVAGMATQSTFVVDGDAELARISAQCRANNTAARTFVVEEFVAGEEWFADGFLSEGELRFLSLGRYAQPCLSAVLEKAPVQTYCLDPVADKAAYELASPLVTDALRVLGLTDGVFHMELFHQPETGTLVFSECAARRAGGPISDQIRYKYGVDLAEAGVRALLEPVAEPQVQVREGVVASTFLPLRPGVVLGCPTVAQVLAQPDVVHARLFVPKGMRVQGGAANTFARMGEVTVHTADVDTAQRRLTELADWFRQHIEVLPLAPTLRELFADPRNADFVHAAAADG